MNSIASRRRIARTVFAGCAVILPCLLGLLGLLAGASFTPPAFAQAPAASSAPDALKEAFDALTEADRRAVQDALVWTGDYKGSIDGVLGRGGSAALAAYAKRAKTTPEDVLAEGKRKQLIAQAQKLRSAARFAAVDESRSGAALAFPAAVFTRKSDTPTGARWTNAAGSASIETFRDANADLPALYERLRAPAPGRKVTYSVLRPDFLVVTGEDQRGLFYTRAARGEVSGKPLTRGYTLVYARALQPAFDTFSIAISNGFQPFPAPAPAPLAAAPAVPRRAVEATAIALSPDRALTAVSRDCPDMRLANRPAKIVRRDEATGLALIETQGLRTMLAHPAVRGAGEADVFALFATQAAGVSLASGRTLGPAASGAPWRVSAAIQDGIGGAAVFDRSGAWMGVVAQPAQEPRRVGGVVPQAAWRMVPAQDVLAFLAASGLKLEAGMITAVEKSAGEVAGANAAALLAVSCQR